MAFQVFFHHKAQKELSKIDSEMQRRIKEKIKELEEFPEERGKHLTHSPFWSLRVGKYRAIYEIDIQSKKITILFVGHRKNVYGDFSKLF